MTLNQWAKKYRQHVGVKGKSRTVFQSEIFDDSDARWDLHHLSDYSVNGVNGGVYWMAPKRGTKKNPRHRNRLGVPEQHQLKIARKTLKMSDAMVGVMGGPNKKEAREIIYRLTGRRAKNNPRRRYRKSSRGRRRNPRASTRKVGIAWMRSKSGRGSLRLANIIRKRMGMSKSSSMLKKGKYQ